MNSLQLIQKQGKRNSVACERGCRVELQVDYPQPANQLVEADEKSREIVVGGVRGHPGRGDVCPFKGQPHLCH
ncbi:hypothetical protein D9M71_740350 [compost metagenome]